MPNQPIQRGRFISVEGGEGAGKSTQIDGLAESITQAGFNVLTTREPGGTASAETIRQLLVTGDTDRWLPQSEALLVMAARMEHVERVIRPALAAGTWVVSDRFFDSTRVYQGLAKGLGDAWLMQLHHLLFGTLAPDLTIYLDIAPEIGLKRAEQRQHNETRFESQTLAFHQMVRQGFCAIAAAEPERVRLIDASQSLEQVAEQIRQLLSSFTQGRTI